MVGGKVGLHARRLAQVWLSGLPERQRFDLTVAFLNAAFASEPRRTAPTWLDRIEALIAVEYRAPDVEQWAYRTGVTLPWLARAYRHWRGEGLSETLLRRRVEAAAILLETDLPLAEIAAHAGFCDQNHMNRAFKKVVGRTPAVARAARLGLSEEQLQAKMQPPARTPKY